jgi:uncharacterized iron-regulated membrane protein
LGSSSLQGFGRTGIRWLVLFHRWLGIVFGLLFAMWFLTGAVLHFVPYPALPEAERLARSPRVDLSRVAIEAAAATRRLPDASGVRLVEVLGRPTYIVERPNAPVTAVGADTGLPLSMLSQREAVAVASAFQGTAAASVDGPLHYDQWIVAQQFDSFRPFYRVKFDDRKATILYVSARSGEVLQRTTFKERAWNWCGAISHWIYFSALRINWSAWDGVVWWLALAALLVASAGAWLGVVRLLAVRRMPRKRLTPFRGWLGWHHRIGLFCGVFVMTWMFSGWLSMDHGRIFSTGNPSAEQISSLRGMSLQASAEDISLASIRAAGPASQILLGAIAGRPFLVSQGAGPTKLSWTEPPDSGSSAAIPASLLVAGVRAAWPGSPVAAPRPVRGDSLYSLAESMTPGTVMIQVGGRNAVDVYVDSIYGRILTVMDQSRRAYAWTFYALHTFKFPGLSTHPALRHIAVLVPLGAGFLFCVSGVIIGVSRLRSTLNH